MSLNEELWSAYNKLKTEHMQDRDSHNNHSSFNNEACRNCNYVYNSRGCLNCANCESCIECVYCIDCKNCAFSVGLMGVTFQILNEQYDEVTYYAKLAEYGIDTEIVSF